MCQEMKSLLVALLLAIGSTVSLAQSSGFEVKLETNSIPKGSALHSEVSWDSKDEEIQSAILKLIPLKTTEVEAKALFAKHMPKRPQKMFNEGGVGANFPESLPDELAKKPCQCFRLFSEVHPLRLGSRWIEVLFFFEEGKLSRVYVGRGGVSA